MNQPEKGSSLVDPRYAKSDQYRQDMEEIVAEQVCPLCPPMKWHPNPILQEDKGWLITRNAHPYPNTEHHLLLICKRHIEDLPELNPEDFQSILDLSQWARQELGIQGGGLIMRFGETLYTGATIKHLHAHLVVPKIEGEQVLPVQFPIG